MNLTLSFEAVNVFEMKECVFKCENCWKGVVSCGSIACHAGCSEYLLTQLCGRAFPSQSVPPQHLTLSLYTVLTENSLPCTSCSSTSFAGGFSLAAFSASLTLDHIPSCLLSMHMTTSGHGKSSFGLRWFDLTQQSPSFYQKLSAVFRCTKLVCGFFCLSELQNSETITYLTFFLSMFCNNVLAFPYAVKSPQSSSFRMFWGTYLLLLFLLRHFSFASV